MATEKVYSSAVGSPWYGGGLADGGDFIVRLTEVACVRTIHSGEIGSSSLYTVEFVLLNGVTFSIPGVSEPTLDSLWVELKKLKKEG
jgi:hypothetical protein